MQVLINHLFVTNESQSKLNETKHKKVDRYLTQLGLMFSLLGFFGVCLGFVLFFWGVCFFCVSVFGK